MNTKIQILKKELFREAKEVGDELFPKLKEVKKEMLQIQEEAKRDLKMASL